MYARLDKGLGVVVCRKDHGYPELRILVRVSRLMEPWVADIAIARFYKHNVPEEQWLTLKIGRARPLRKIIPLQKMLSQEELQRKADELSAALIEEDQKVVDELVEQHRELEEDFRENPEFWE